MQWPSSIKSIYPLSYGASHSDSLIQVHIERQAGISVEFGLLLWHIEHVFVCLIHILGLSWVFQTGILEFPVYDIVCTALCSVSEHLSIWDCMQVGEFHDLHMTIVGAQVHQDGNYTGLHSSKLEYIHISSEVPWSEIKMHLTIGIVAPAFWWKNETAQGKQEDARLVHISDFLEPILTETQKYVYLSSLLSLVKCKKYKEGWELVFK